VKAYRDRNYRVVATARSIKPSGDADILVVAGDIADRETAEAAISASIARFGRIDTLVNNAGIFIAKPFTQYTEADYAAILGVNVAGFFHITQLAVAEMEKQGSGHIVQITTSLVDHAISGVPSVLASLTKGGLAAATKSLAIEYAKRGIRVNLGHRPMFRECPGGTYSDVASSGSRLGLPPSAVGREAHYHIPNPVTDATGLAGRLRIRRRTDRNSPSGRRVPWQRSRAVPPFANRLRPFVRPPLEPAPNCATGIDSGEHGHDGGNPQLGQPVRRRAIIGR
jgi:hypothetical protein